MLFRSPEGLKAFCLLVRLNIKLPTEKVIAENRKVPEHVNCGELAYRATRCSGRENQCPMTAGPNGAPGLRWGPTGPLALGKPGPSGGALAGPSPDQGPLHILLVYEADCACTA